MRQLRDAGLSGSVRTRSFAQAAILIFERPCFAALLRTIVAAGVELRATAVEESQATSGSEIDGTQPRKSGSSSDESEEKAEDQEGEGDTDWVAPLTQTKEVKKRLPFGNKSPKTNPRATLTHVAQGLPTTRTQVSLV